MAARQYAKVVRSTAEYGTMPRIPRMSVTQGIATAMSSTTAWPR
jgi:hypothetical protein